MVCPFPCERKGEASRWQMVFGLQCQGQSLEKKDCIMYNDLANLGSVGYRRHAVSFKQHLPGEQHDIVEQAPWI